MTSVPALLALAACAAPATSNGTAPPPAPAVQDTAERPSGPSVDVVVETLPNGVVVIYHVDHSLPSVVINTWFAVGSKDEEPGRTGFAHLFEHLMFMGTGRVPDDGFDVLMESGGGSNNASTSNDRTNYYSEGPAALLPTLLWLDADRLDALADHMTQEKLDLQREVVRNERRQTSENTPYGKAWLTIPQLLYPEGHPYRHPVIGSHADLEAATVDDVVRFFRTWYVPGNASLVVAGDFDIDAVRPIVARTFGAVPAAPLPIRRTAPPVVLEREVRAVDTDRVRHAKLILVWPTPAAFGPGDAELDLAAGVLAGGPSTRLERRLVHELGLALEVDAFQVSRELVSQFHVEVLAAPGADLELVKRETLAVIDDLATNGATSEELDRVRVGIEASLLRGMEDLGSRADSMNRYRHHFGTPDGFALDLARYRDASAADVQTVVRASFGPGRVDLRVLPEGASAVARSALDERPADLPTPAYTPPTPANFTLPNGVTVHAVPRPGSGLFAGRLVVAGGAAEIGPDRAGLAALTASVLNSGAGGRDASDFAGAVESLGASVQASAGRSALTVGVSGLASRFDATLALVGDLVTSANLAAGDFEREQGLQLAAIDARSDDPRALASLVGRRALFGRGDARGRPLDGYRTTVEALTLDDVRQAAAKLLEPRRATLVFVGDFELDALRAALGQHLANWKSAGPESTGAVDARFVPERDGPRILFVDRPGAPQTVVTILRPLDDTAGVERQARLCAATVFGGTFTSRLNSNLREDKGYTYGASCRIQESDTHTMLYAGSSVRTDVTGASLVEFRNEFERMRADGIDARELQKALETRRRRLQETAGTTGSLVRTLAGFVADGRALDSVAADLAALDAVTLEAANAEARSDAYDWSRLLVVLVGDGEAVLPQLAAAGLPEPALVEAE